MLQEQPTKGEEMTDDLPAAWLLARNALDHHDTVTALAAALPDLASPGGGLAFDPKDLAATQAEHLGRAGYALIRLDAPESDTSLTAQVDQHLRDEAASSWFGRDDDQ
jgi:hypothetical protein